MNGCQGDTRDYCDDISSWECYNNTVSHHCCQSCNDNLIQPVVPGCEFGDHVEQCNVENGMRCYNNTVLMECCNKCQSYETSDPGCEFGDHVEQCNVENGMRCYNNTVRMECCNKCQSYETSDPGCRYGDKIDNCKQHECNVYSQKRHADCCMTCVYDVTTRVDVSTVTWSTHMNSITTTSTSTDSPVTSVTSAGTGVPAWTVPVAAGVGGVLVLVIAVLVVVLCRRNRKSDHLSPIDDRMYNDYKMTKRAPMALPRHPSTEKGWVDEKEESAEYAYIHPDNVEGPQSQNSNPQSEDRRSGDDPLPPTPGEYLDLSGAETVKYGYNPSQYLARDSVNNQRVPSNKYDTFPGSQPYTNQPENGNISQRL